MFVTESHFSNILIWLMLASLTGVHVSPLGAVDPAGEDEAPAFDSYSPANAVEGVSQTNEVE
jgi:hypothetical protein